MNRVEIAVEEVPLPAWAPAFSRYLAGALDALGKSNWDLSVLFCGDALIRRLNNRYRGRDEATDVLSFSLGEPADGGPDGADGSLPQEGGQGGRWLPGDIIISLETLKENAAYFGVSEDEELRRLAIHGILHLDGMDHGTDGPEEPMLKLQEKLLGELEGGGFIPPPADGPPGNEP